MENKETTLEELFGDLDNILRQMENDDIPLEDAFKLYEEGILKVKACNEKLDMVEKKMQIINADGSLSDMPDMQ